MATGKAEMREAGSRFASPAQVTVIIPAFKAERTINRAIDSVLSQQDVDVRAVVVVDGLLDGTCDRLRSYGCKVKVFVNSDNIGAARARNRGLAAVNTEFVMFLDCDDFLEGRILAGLSERMIEDKADIGFAPMCSLVESRGARRIPLVPRFGSVADVLRSWLVEGRFVGTCSVLWRTSFVRSIDGWDDTVGRNDDGELVMRAMLLGASFTISDVGCGIYVQHDDPERLTSRADNLDDLLRVAEKLLHMQTSVIEKEQKLRLIAAHFYNIAAACYSSGREDLAAAALRRSRQLGFTGHLGPLWQRVARTVLGLPMQCRISNLLRRLRRQVLGLLS